MGANTVEALVLKGLHVLLAFAMQSIQVQNKI